jgi:CHAD domain-containing protein
MAFKFKTSDDSVLSGLKRMVDDQVDEALKHLEAPLDAEKRIHELRKTSKDLRALLRLVRPSFPAYRDENAAIRDAAAALSASRDADVVLQTFDSLLHEDERPRFAVQRETLVKDAEEARTHDLLPPFRAAMLALRERVQGWELNAEGFAALRGLGLTFRQMRSAMRKAEATRDPVDFHEWRKAVKTHAAHLGILKELAPDILGGARDTAKTLGEVLGEHHDLAVLSDQLGHDTPSAEEMQARIRTRMDEKEGKALELGRQVLAEKPAAFEARMRRLWKTWAETGNGH